MIIDSGIVTGSFQVIGNTEITGSLKVTGGLTGSIFGTASYANNADTVDGRHASEFVLNSATSSLATQTYVNTAVSNLVDAAPGTLDTLNELAAALGDDPNFATTVATSIGTKQNQLNGTGFVKASGATISYDNSTYTPTSRTLTINGTSFDLSADRSWSIASGVTSFNTRTGAITLSSGDVTTALGYTPYNATNPNGYITGISFANVSSKPTTLSGYGITDAVPSARTITINGTTLDLSANRSFTVTASDATKLPLAGGTMTGIITTVSSGTAINFSGQSDSFGYNATSGLGTYIKGTGSTYLYGGGSFFDGSAQRVILHAGNFNSYSPTLTGGGASGTWGINITGNAATVTNGLTTSNYTSTLDGRYFYNRGFGAGFPSENANTMPENTAAFTYSNNAPLTGCIAYFPASGYGIQLNGDYGGDSFSMRSRNGDNGTFRPWKRLLTDFNFGSYAINRSGDTVSSIIYYLTNNGGQAVNNSNSAVLQAYSTGNNSAFMSFHKAGHFAINFGLDNDNVMRIGGWSAAANRWQLDMSGNMTVAGDVTAFSDRRVKENIVTVDKALEKVNALRGVYYNRNDSDDKRTKLGVIAQEVLEIIPEVVSQDNDGMYNVSYGNLAGLFIEAIKEQQQQIEELKQLVNQLTQK